MEIGTGNWYNGSMIHYDSSSYYNYFLLMDYQYPTVDKRYTLHEIIRFNDSWTDMFLTLSRTVLAVNCLFNYSQAGINVVLNTTFP